MRSIKVSDHMVERPVTISGRSVVAEALEGNPQLIQLRIAEKWDGTLPRFSGGDSIPLINIDSLDKPSR